MNNTQQTPAIRVYVHSYIERPDGVKECFLTREVQHTTNQRGQLRVLWLGRWRTVRDAARHPNRQLLVRDDYTRTRVSSY